MSHLEDELKRSFATAVPEMRKHFHLDNDYDERITPIIHQSVMSVAG